MIIERRHDLSEGTHDYRQYQDVFLLREFSQSVLSNQISGHSTHTNITSSCSNIVT